MVKVSSPPEIRIPDEFQKKPGTRKFFENLSFWLFLLWKRTGGGTDAIASMDTDQTGTLAAIIDINQRLGSGQFLTSDSDSFTVDTTELFVDLTEA